MATIIELRSKAMTLSPVIRIGKSGITDAVIGEIVKLLKKKKLIKVKLLRSFVETADRKKTAKELADKTGSVLVQQTGFVVVLYREKVDKK